MNEAEERQRLVQRLLKLFVALLLRGKNALAGLRAAQASSARIRGGSAAPTGSRTLLPILSFESRNFAVSAAKIARAKNGAISRSPPKGDRPRQRRVPTSSAGLFWRTLMKLSKLSCCAGTCDVTMRVAAVSDTPPASQQHVPS